MKKSLIFALALVAGASLSTVDAAKKKKVVVKEEAPVVEAPAVEEAPVVEAPAAEANEETKE